MRGFTVRTREADARGLIDVVYAHRDQIEAAGADPAGFRSTQSLLDDALQIVRIGDGFRETQFGARDFARECRE